jgi:hypothetical protein
VNKIISFSITIIFIFINNILSANNRLDNPENHFSSLIELNIGYEKSEELKRLSNELANDYLQLVRTIDIKYNNYRFGNAYMSAIFGIDIKETYTCSNGFGFGIQAGLINNPAITEIYDSSNIIVYHCNVDWNSYTLGTSLHYKKYLFSILKNEDAFYLSVLFGIRMYYAEIISEIKVNDPYDTSSAPYSSSLTYKYKAKNYGYYSSLVIGWDLAKSTFYLSVNYQNVTMNKFKSNNSTLTYKDGTTVGLTIDPITVSFGGGFTY